MFIRRYTTTDTDSQPPPPHSPLLHGLDLHCTPPLQLFHLRYQLFTSFTQSFLVINQLQQGGQNTSQLHKSKGNTICICTYFGYREIYANIYTYILYVRTYMYVRMRVHMHNMLQHARMHAHTHTHMYVYTCTHTYT